MGKQSKESISRGKIADYILQQISCAELSAQEPKFRANAPNQLQFC